MTVMTISHYCANQLPYRIVLGECPDDTERNVVCLRQLSLYLYPDNVLSGMLNPTIALAV